MIATGLVHVPKPSDQIILFELFCRIIKRLQDLGNFTMTKKICKMIGKQSILELLLDWNIEGFEFGELLNIPSHHIHWEEEKEAYIMKLDEMIIITSETMCFTIHSLGILEAEISEDLDLVVRLEFPESEVHTSIFPYIFNLIFLAFRQECTETHSKFGKRFDGTCGIFDEGRNLVGIPDQGVLQDCRLKIH